MNVESITRALEGIRSALTGLPVEVARHTLWVALEALPAPVDEATPTRRKREQALDPDSEGVRAAVEAVREGATSPAEVAARLKTTNTLASLRLRVAAGAGLLRKEGRGRYVLPAAKGGAR